MPKSKLKNAPLQEVIFELRWQLDYDESGTPLDAGFDLAKGVFAYKIKNYFPVNKSLFPSNFNIRLAGIPLYQFWTDELTWPVVQLGQGILSVNDTEKNYTWNDSFLPNIQRSIRALQESYDVLPTISGVKLQYIDAIEFDREKISPVQFLEQNMNTVLDNRYGVLGQQQKINISQEFSIEQNSVLQLNIQNGISGKTGNAAIIWTTSVGTDANVDFDTLATWLEFAHNIASETFIKMLNPSFYASFDA